MICSNSLREYISENPVMLAPLSGVSDLPFRKMVCSFGPALVFSEMIASRAMVIQTRDSMRKAAICDTSDIKAMQIAGYEPEVMAEAARLNVDLGADLIDINFGCPVKKIVNNYSGSAIMKDEDLATRILEAVVNAVKVPVTLKMRMGWDMSSLNAPKLAKIAEEIGVAMITIHGRTRSQLFSGKADWRFVKKVKDIVSVPVIVNGDIKTIEDVKNAMELSGADGVMIGRGAYGKPWIIESIKRELIGESAIEFSDLEKKEILVKHLDLIVEHYGVEHGILIFRKHFGWTISGMKDGAKIRAKVMQIKDFQELKNTIDDFFN